MSRKLSAKERRKRTLFSRGPVFCALCQLEIKTKEEANWDHIIPKSLGGANHWENLQITHRICNLKRGNNQLNDKTIILAVKTKLVHMIINTPAKELEKRKTKQVLNYLRKRGTIIEVK